MCDSACGWTCSLPCHFQYGQLPEKEIYSKVDIPQIIQTLMWWNLTQEIISTKNTIFKNKHKENRFYISSQMLFPEWLSLLWCISQTSFILYMKYFVAQPGLVGRLTVSFAKIWFQSSHLELKFQNKTSWSFAEVFLNWLLESSTECALLTTHETSTWSESW